MIFILCYLGFFWDIRKSLRKQPKKNQIKQQKKDQSCASVLTPKLGIAHGYQITGIWTNTIWFCCEHFFKIFTGNFSIPRLLFLCRTVIGKTRKWPKRSTGRGAVCYLIRICQDFYVTLVLCMFVSVSACVCVCVYWRGRGEGEGRTRKNIISSILDAGQPWGVQRGSPR